MLFRQLECFCSAAELASFTRAAEALHVSQSAISQQVKALESDLGCRLVERRGRGFSLTPAGEHLARRGRALLDEAERLRYEVEDVAYGRPRRLRVGYLNRYDGWEVAGAVAALTRRHPALEVTATPDSHDGLYRRLLSGELDVAFNDRRRELSEDFCNRLLARTWSYVEVSEGSDLFGLDAVTAGDLAGKTCIVVASPEQEEAERAHYRDRLNFDCAFVRADSLEQARFMVAGNKGFLPVGTRREGEALGNVIRRIPVMVAAGDGAGAREHAHSDYYAFWLRAGEHPMAAEFADVLADLFA